MDEPAGPPSKQSRPAANESDAFTATAMDEQAGPPRKRSRPAANESDPVPEYKLQVLALNMRSVTLGQAVTHSKHGQVTVTMTQAGAVQTLRTYYYEHDAPNLRAACDMYVKEVACHPDGHVPWNLSAGSTVTVQRIKGDEQQRGTARRPPEMQYVASQPSREIPGILSKSKAPAGWTKSKKKTLCLNPDHAAHASGKTAQACFECNEKYLCANSDHAAHARRKTAKNCFECNEKYLCPNSEHAAHASGMTAQGCFECNEKYLCPNSEHAGSGKTAQNCFECNPTPSLVNRLYIPPAFTRPVLRPLRS